MKKTFATAFLPLIVALLLQGTSFAAPKKSWVHGEAASEVGISTPVNEVVATTARGFKCDDSKDYVSLSYLRALMANEDFGVFGVRDGEKIKIDISGFTYISQGCFEPQFEYGKIPGTDKKHFLRVKNLLKPDTEEYRNMTQEQFLNKCLKEKGILKNGALQVDRSSFEKHIGSMAGSQEEQWTIDANDYADIYFMSPDDGDRWHETDEMEKDLRGKVPCYNLEYFDKKQPAKIIKNEISDLNKSKSVDCDSVECTKEKYEMIFSIYSDMGNLGELKEIAQKIIEETLNNIKLNRKEIKKKLNDKYYNPLIALAEQITTATDESTIRELVADYGMLIDKIRDEVVDPAVEELKLRYEQAAKAKTKEEKLAFNRRIAELNDIIKQFDDEDKKLRTKEVLRKLEQYGLSAAASDVAELKLKSHEFGKVNHELSNRQTVAVAQKKIDAQMKKYKNDLELAEKVSRAKSGDARYSKDYYRKMQDLQKSKQRLYTQYVQNEQKLAKSCQSTMFTMGSATNPVRCQSYINGQSTRMRRLQSAMSSYDSKISQNQTMMQNFLGYESEARQKRQQEMGSDVYTSDESVIEFGLFEDNMMDDWTLSSSSGYGANMGMNMGTQSYGYGSANQFQMPGYQTNMMTGNNQAFRTQYPQYMMGN